MEFSLGDAGDVENITYISGDESEYSSCDMDRDRVVRSHPASVGQRRLASFRTRQIRLLFSGIDGRCAADPTDEPTRLPGPTGLP